MPMYSLANEIPTGLSASANLDALAHLKHKNVNYLAVHDLEKVSVISIGSNGATSNKEIVFEAASNDNRRVDDFIQIAKLILLQDKVFLVAASSKTVKIFSEDNGLQMIFSHNLTGDHKLGQIVHSTEAVNKCIFGLGTQSKVHFFSINSKDTTFKVKEMHPDFKSSARSVIHSFTSNGQSQCAVAESVGVITVWKFEESKSTFLKVTSIEVHPNTKAAGLKLYGNLLLLATISGQIQLISLATGQLLSEIQAHVKCITSFDIATKSSYLVTCSEDSHVRVFRLGTGSDDKCRVEHLEQKTIENELVFGVKFLDTSGNQLAVCTYESTCIKMFKLNK